MTGRVTRIIRENERLTRNQAVMVAREVVTQPLRGRPATATVGTGPVWDMALTVPTA